MRTLIKNVKVITPYEIRENFAVGIEEDIIIDINEQGNFNEVEFDKIIDGHGNYLSPGFIDIHNHGNYGHDIMEGTVDALRSMAIFHMKNGVTSFLGTTMTGSYESISSALTCGTRYINDYKNTRIKDRAQFLGFYLEGPYFSQEKKGAQPAEHIKKTNILELQSFIEQSQDNIRIVALAPEVDEDFKTIKYLKNRGITISAGHSNADYVLTSRAIDNGITQATHLFNGMRDFSHREPGIIGAVLTDERVACEIICDGIHIHPVAMKMAVELKGKDGIILVSDAMMATGLQDGEYELGGQKVYTKNGAARLSNGSLAGSTLTLNKAVFNMVNMVNTPLHDAVRMASLNPAKAIGISDRKGSIEVGKDADMIIFDENVDICLAIIGGHVVE